MNINHRFNNSIMNFFRKEKKRKGILSSLDTLKTISVITGTALAVNKAMKEKLQNREYFITHKKEQRRNETGAVIAGLVGGIVAGAVTALLLAPESGEDLRHRVSDMLGSGNGYDEDTIIEEARQKAEALAAKAKDQAENAEQNLKDN